MANIRRKHVPQRTCIGCRQVRPKRDMVRIIHTQEGKIQVDETGKQAGRGAYLCRNQSCWEAGLAKGRIEHALRAHLSTEERHALEEFRQALPAVEEVS
jgi:predicted RNA-binding protein YlxR (DUF448 family)